MGQSHIIFKVVCFWVLHWREFNSMYVDIYRTTHLWFIIIDLCVRGLWLERGI